MKEKVYDERIAPLMAQILEICREAKIAMLADFMLDGELRCTSALLRSDFDPSVNQLRAFQLLKPDAGGTALAETHETMPDGSKRISIRRIS